MKSGRNAPCWCGSGVKYKKCHYGRAEAEGVSLSAGLAALKEARAARDCHCPPALRGECSGPPIKSHTISQGLGLRKLARQGHVLSFKHDVATLKRTNGKIEVGKIGINKMSVFPGFCSTHDKALFAPLEDSAFVGTQEQCALLSYRALARERHTKTSGSQINGFLKMTDRGKPLFDQIMIQSFLAQSGMSLSVATQDLDRALEPHLEAVINRDFSVFQSAILEFPERFPLLCSTGHMPHDDWGGNIVQDIADMTLTADWLTAVSFRSSERSWIVFTWLKSVATSANYVRSLRAHFAGTEADALVKYFFSVSDNIAIQPEWWETLDKDAKRALEARIMDGMPINGGLNITAPRPREPIVLDLPLISYTEL